MNRKHLLVVVCVLILAFQACSSPSPTPVSEPTETATIATPTSTLMPTVTPTSTSTPIPLAWTQIYDGQDFERDMVSAFATDKKDPNVIYAGMKNSGVYKTVDGGLSWLPVNQGLTSTKVESLFIDMQNPLTLYAGTIGGVFKTEDGGENWFRVGEGTYLLMDYQDISHLYARDENAIYETNDQGSTWEVVHSLKKDCPDEIHSWVILPADGDTLFVGGGESCAGVYKSSDSGSVWTSIGMKDKPNIDTLGIGQDKNGKFSIYTYFDSPSVPDWGMYILRDGDTNWTFAQGVECNILASNPDKPTAIYCHDYSSMYVLRNDGTPWKLVPGSQSKFYSAIHIDSPNNMERIISGATDVSHGQHPYVGIFISTDDGNSWTERSSGISSARSELKIDPINSDNMYLATYHIGGRSVINCTLSQSLDGGINWSMIKANAGWCGPSFDSADAFYLTERGSLQKSWDGGKNWLWNGGYFLAPKGYYSNNPGPIEINNSLPQHNRESLQSISANPYIDNLVYAVGNTIYYSTTGTGSSWQLSTGSEGSWDARLFYTDPSKMIFAIGRYHQKYSTDNGMTWQACGEDITTAQSDSRLALDLQGERLYLATPGQGVLVSTDKCGSWQASNNGPGNLFVNTVAIDPNKPDIVYAGTDGGAYISFDGGTTWGQINNGLIGSNIVYSIAVDSESNVYATTPYGVFELEQK